LFGYAAGLERKRAAPFRKRLLNELVL
jgi:hypothetical protein